MGILFEHNLSGFAAGEVESITGLTQAMQRQWRAWGFLPKNRERKHSRLDVRDIGEILIVRSLMASGVPHAEAQLWIPFASGVIVKAALAAPGAIEGDIALHPLRSALEIARYVALQYSASLADFDLVVWATGEVEAVADGPQALADASAAKGGSAKVFMLGRIGASVAGMAGRALLTIEQVECDDPTLSRPLEVTLQ